MSGGEARLAKAGDVKVQAVRGRLLSPSLTDEFTAETSRGAIRVQAFPEVD